VKIRGAVSEIPIPIVEALPRTELFEIHLMAVLCVAAEHGGLIKKKKTRKRGNCECFTT